MLSSAPDIAHEDQFPDILNYVHIENRTKGFSGIFSNGQRFIYFFFFLEKLERKISINDSNTKPLITADIAEVSRCSTKNS